MLKDPDDLDHEYEKLGSQLIFKDEWDMKNFSQAELREHFHDYIKEILRYFANDGYPEGSDCSIPSDDTLEKTFSELAKSSHCDLILTEIIKGLPTENFIFEEVWRYLSAALKNSPQASSLFWVKVRDHLVFSKSAGFGSSLYVASEIMFNALLKGPAAIENAWVIASNYDLRLLKRIKANAPLVELKFDAPAPLVASYNSEFFWAQVDARGIDRDVVTLLVDSWDGDLISFLDSAASLSSEA